MKLKEKLLSLGLISVIFSGCALNQNSIKKIDLNPNMKQEKEYVHEQVSKMVKMIYENNFIQRKIADNIDDLGTYTVNNYNYTVNKVIKVKYDDIDKIITNKIKNFNNKMIAFIIKLIDYNNNINTFIIKRFAKGYINYYYALNNKTGEGKIITKDKIQNYKKNYFIYNITYANNGILYIKKLINNKFKEIKKINLNKIKNITSFDNIIIIISKKKNK